MVSKRSLVMREPSPSLLFPHRDSLLCYGLEGLEKKLELEAADDDTASTVSSLDESFSSTTAVSFVEEIVTAVYVRPATTLAEKRDLYYSDTDYRRFRYEFYYKREPRETTVKFSPTLVSHVHAYPEDIQLDKDTLFYSEKDLQRCVEHVSERSQSQYHRVSNASAVFPRFLDDFVSSLHETCASE